MSRPFLALCQDVVSDLGVAGGTLQSVSGQTSKELNRIINWVARADLMVQNIWSDWNFLWQADSYNVPVGQDWFQTNAAFNEFDRLSVALNADNNAVGTTYPQFLDWNAFRIAWQNNVKQPSTNPSNFSIDPTGKLWLSHSAQVVLPLSFAYWKVPVRMQDNSDISPIPTQFDQIICERAKLMYAQRENAPEILTGSMAEFDDLKDKLEAACLPESHWVRKSSNDVTTTQDAYVE